MLRSLAAVAAIELLNRSDIEDNRIQIYDAYKADDDCQIGAPAKGATPNQYKPHQGAKEMARRRKQMKGQA